MTTKGKITATENRSNRTFTLRKFDENGKCYSKYRTITMGKDEFENARYWSENDWKQFLKTDEYYIIK